MTTLLKETLARESIYMPSPARIVRMEPITEFETLFTLELPSGFTLDHRPGQFVQVSLLGVGEAPISVCSAPSQSGHTFELCVRRVGRVTNAMHMLKPGSMVGIRGPFGRPFPIERFRGKDMLLIGGGLGMAPLRSVIDEVMNSRGMFGRVIILYGARTPADLLFRKDLKDWAARRDVEMTITVDRATPDWRGNVGVVTSLLPQISFRPRNMVAVVIGPPVMYKFVLRDIAARGIPDGNIWVSFERQMKCGVGKCGHCQMHHIYTCQEGPSFAYSEFKHLEEALL